MNGPQGEADPRFAAVRAAFAANLADGSDLGASLAVWAEGRLVVDLWGGFEDAARTRPWRRTALVNVWSVTKAWASAVIARLVQEGALDYAAPVARWWPEFAAAGKEAITLGRLLSHQAGLPGVETPLSVQDLYDHGPYVDAFAAAAPLWAPGTQGCYHATSFGPLADAVVRGATGRSIGAHLAAGWAGPEGVPGDLAIFIGLPEAEDHRAVEIVLGPGMREERAAVEGLARMIRNPWYGADVPNERAWRAAEIPSGNGHADAASLARLMGSLIDPERPSLSPAILAEATRERMRGRDAAWDWEMRFGAGFQLNSDGMFGPNDGAFGHGGMGGALGFADPEAGIAIGYAPNRLLLSADAAPRRDRLFEALYDAL